MPTSYLKKLAKLNHTTVNKLEKFWSQAKEIAKSEGHDKQWGLITTIFQDKLKKEGYRIEACTMKKIIAFNENRLDNSTKALYETMNEGSFQYNYRTDDNFNNFMKTTMADEVVDVIRSSKSLINRCIEKRSKTQSIVWDALTLIFLHVIKYNSLKVSLSSDKIKNWFKFNNTDYQSALKPVVESVDELRKELRETEK